MRWEQLAAEALEIDWTVKIFSLPHKSLSAGIFEFSVKVLPGERRNLLRRARDYMSFRREYYAWLKAESKKYDVILLRYSTSDPFLHAFISGCQKPVYLVHHTLELSELRAMGGVANKFRIGLERICRARNHEASSGFIGVTKEILQHRPKIKAGDRPNFCYPNGVMVEDFAVSRREVEKSKNQVAVLIFVASQFSRWHGLDLLLDSIEKSKADFVLHIAGHLEEKDRIRAENDRRIFLHGHVTKKKLEDLISVAEVGLSSFALHRNGMKEACPLKSREYLAQGLAIYGGHRDIFPEGCVFYKEGRPDIAAILEFRDQIVQMDRGDILNQARPYIEKKKLLLELSAWLTATALK